MSDQQPYQPYPEDSARREYEASLVAPEKPQSIRTAVLLMKIGAALSLVGSLVSLVLLSTVKDEIRDRLADQNPDYTQSDLNAAFTAAIVVSVVFGLIAIFLWLWMARANGNGRKWARVVATVLASLSFLSFVANASSPDRTVLGVVFSVLNVLIGVTAVVFLYRSDARAYFNSMSRRPRP